MKTIIISIFSLFLVSLFSIPPLQAKRKEPTPVPPILYNGIQYRAPHWGKMNGKEQNGGYIEAWDPKLNKKLWELRVYSISSNNHATEADIWDVFITALSIQNGQLIVVNEKNERYAIDLEQQKVVQVLPTKKNH